MCDSVRAGDDCGVVFYTPAVRNYFMKRLGSELGFDNVPPTGIWLIDGLWFIWIFQFWFSSFILFHTVIAGLPQQNELRWVIGNCFYIGFVPVVFTVVGYGLSRWRRLKSSFVFGAAVILITPPIVIAVASIVDVISAS